MRHRKSGRQLNRNSSHRKAMFRNMAISLFEHEAIKTTVPKAKELRRVVEPLITLAKNDSVANRRLAFNRLRDKAIVGKLFTDLGPHYETRPGGYMRLLKCGYRKGDKAPMAYVELVERQTLETEMEAQLKNATETFIVDEPKEAANTKEEKPKKETKAKEDKKPKKEKTEEKEKAPKKED